MRWNGMKTHTVTTIRENNRARADPNEKTSPHYNGNRNLARSEREYPEVSTCYRAGLSALDSLPACIFTSRRLRT